MVAKFFFFLVVVALQVEASVIKLTDQDFGSKTKEGTWFIKFYAPWCGHCKRLTPVWDELGSAFVGNPEIHIGKVDCTVEKDVGKAFNIRGYPTLKVIYNGKMYDYKGDRSLSSLKSFVEGNFKSNEGSALPNGNFVQVPDSDVVDLTSDNFDGYIASGEWMVKFFAPWCGHCKSMAPAWEEFGKSAKLSRQNGKKLFVGKVDCTIERDLASRFGIKGFPTLLHIKDGEVRKYTGSRTPDNFMSFAQGEWKSINFEPLPKAGEKSYSNMIEYYFENHFWIAVSATAVFFIMLVGGLIALLDYCLGPDSEEKLSDTEQEEKTEDHDKTE